MPTAASRLSSSFGKRLPAVLWGVAAAALVALVVLLVLSFTGQGPTRRDAVAAYIGEVNRVEVGASAELKRIDGLYRRFGRTPAALAKQVPDLERAERTLRRLRGRVAAVQPPEEARRLHTLLLRLFALDVVLAGDVTDLARYLPALAQEQAPLAKTIERLRRDVDRARTAPEQARAFDAYATATRRIATRIEELRAPRAFAETQRAEVTRLRRLADLAVRVQTALENEQPGEAVRLFSTLGAVASSTAVARAEREAALAYNRRLRTIGTVARAIERERKRLDLNVE